MTTVPQHYRRMDRQMDDYCSNTVHMVVMMNVKMLYLMKFY